MLTLRTGREDERDQRSCWPGRDHQAGGCTNQHLAGMCIVQTLCFSVSVANTSLQRQVTNRKNNEGKAERLAWEKAHRSSPRSAKKTKSVDRGRITKRS